MLFKLYSYFRLNLALSVNKLKAKLNISLKYNIKMYYCIKKLNRYFADLVIISIFIIYVIQTVFGFLITLSSFDISEIFNLSPLFDFSYSNDCQGKSEIIFHKWEGRTESKWTLGDYAIPKKETKIFDQTDIKKINGNYFCYRKILYKDLLYNGQIIKKGEECPSEYKKNCGRLDTLEQELCIKENEKCPLYDIGIGSAPDSVNYHRSDDSKIYYNKDTYNNPNKTIIGRLILSDGQPCLNASEKLWKSFSTKEGFETNLKCDLEIFGEYVDYRYEQRGNISYEQLYEDNLNLECQNIVLRNVSHTDKVTLYKREFFGIDKECDEKYNLNNNTYNIIHNSEEVEYYLLIVGGFLFGSVIFSLLLPISIIYLCIKEDDFYELCSPIFYSISYLVYIVIILSCFICYTVFFARVVNNDLTGYNCSDTITNEVIRKGFEDSANNIYYIKINYYLELVCIVINILAIFIAYYLDKKKKAEPVKSKEESKEKENDDFNEKAETKTSEVPLMTYPTPS